MLLTGATLAGIATLALAASHAPTAAKIHPPAPRGAIQDHLQSGLPVTLASTASVSIGASERSFWPVRRGPSLLTRGGGIRSVFSASGARLRVSRGTLDLSLASVGRGQDLEGVKMGAPSGEASQILYRDGSIGEFYRNGPYGLEQGFTLRKRPQTGSGSLVLTLRVGGSLIPEQAGSQILFGTRAGAIALRYGELSAIDATGRELPAHLRLGNGTIQLLIDDGNARYPLRIDPFFEQQGSKLAGAEESGKGRFGSSVALSADGDTAVIGGPNDNSKVGAAWVFTRSGSTWEQQGPKLTGSEESGKGHFGYSVALSGDGDTALIGGSSDKGGVGAAWVFTRSGSTWEQQGPKLAGAGESGAGEFGLGVALSADGEEALIGGPDDNSEVGAAWVFTRSGTTWEQQGSKLTGGEESGKGRFGASVALAEGGETALIGGPNDNSNVGAGWVFTRSGTTWEQQGAKLTGSGESGDGHFGYSVALSASGETALIGGLLDNDEVGAAWVFTRSGSSWEQQGSKLTGSGESGTGLFGYSVALSGSGNTALIGGRTDSGGVGAAWVFARSGSTWEQQGSKLTGSGESGDGLFGSSVALSADGFTALIGGADDRSEAGAVWAFVSTQQAPTVVTGTASSVTQTSATLNATVNPNGGTVSNCQFNYGTSTSYGNSVPCTTLPGSGTSPVAVSAPLTGLSGNTTYHFQIVATNPYGTSEGADQKFTTANPPEFGRCVKVAKGVKGQYSTAACTLAATSLKYSYEWEGGPGPKAKFTTKIKESTVATLETIHKKQVVCKDEASTGELSGPKTIGNVVVTFTACEMGGSKCSSADAGEGEVVTKTLEGALGIEQKSSEGPIKNKIAMDLLPVGESGPVMEFSCGPTAVSVKGSVLVPVKSNTMMSVATLKFTGTVGKQKPEGFEGLPKDVLETSFAEASAEQSALKLTTIQMLEEKIEINSVV